jgi:hypothetical protein
VYGLAVQKMALWLPFLAGEKEKLQARMSRQQKGDGDAGQAAAPALPAGEVVAPAALPSAPAPAPPGQGGPGWEDDDFDAWADSAAGGAEEPPVEGDDAGWLGAMDGAAGPPGAAAGEEEDRPGGAGEGDAGAGGEDWLGDVLYGAGEEKR